jgi:hypothetical protein
VKEHHNSCLVQPLLRMGPVDVATSTISSSTTNNNTTVTTARMQPIATTATTAYINAMLTSCHLLEEEEYTRRLRVSSLWSTTSLTRKEQIGDGEGSSGSTTPGATNLLKLVEV